MFLLGMPNNGETPNWNGVHSLPETVTILAKYSDPKLMSTSAPTSTAPTSATSAAPTSTAPTSTAPTSTAPTSTAPTPPTPTPPTPPTPAPTSTAPTPTPTLPPLPPITLGVTPILISGVPPKIMAGLGLGVSKVNVMAIGKNGLPVTIVSTVNNLSPSAPGVVGAVSAVATKVQEVPSVSSAFSATYVGLSNQTQELNGKGDSQYVAKNNLYGKSTRDFLLRLIAALNLIQKVIKYRSGGKLDVLECLIVKILHRLGRGPRELRDYLKESRVQDRIIKEAAKSPKVPIVKPLPVPKFDLPSEFQPEVKDSLIKLAKYRVDIASLLYILAELYHRS
jgi:hypothetical protein